MNKILFILTVLLLTSLLSIPTKAQLQAWEGDSNDQSCKTFYLVNPTESIYYVAGLRQNELGKCRTFAFTSGDNQALCINLSSHERHYLLLLPRDTITYKILLDADKAGQSKVLDLFIRKADAVIESNDEGKRNRKIKRLAGEHISLPVSER